MSYETHVLTLNNDEKLGKGYLAKVREKFPSALLDAEWQTANQVTITVKLNSLPEIVEYLYYQLGGWLPVLFGNDERTLTGDFAVYYVLSMEEGEKCFITVKAQVSAITLEFPSVTPRVPAAVWGEREIRDMYGLIPVGLPDERRLVLPDDWPDDLYPLRKDTMDYRQRPEPTTDVETYPFENAATGESRVVPIGPMHITSDEPGHFRLFVDGERIVDADYRLFYVHRGMEKLAETRMGYQEVTFLSDRVCGICGFTHSVAYTTSVENALGIYVPPRAHAIRSILLEVERLHSHLLNIGLSSHFVGFDTGLIFDVTQLVEMLLGTPNIEQRTKGIGLLDRQIARDYSPVGPMIRASGFKRDMRFDHPYANYGSLPKTLFTFDGCDVYSRVMVRVQEVLDSLAMIEYGLDNLPGGPLLTEGFRYQPHKFALGYAEAPRGADIHWSMLGDNQKLFRWRCRAATYANWPVLRYMLRGNTVSDAPLIIGSLDPCYSCTDRVTLIDINKRKAKTVPYKEIERYGIERTNSPCK